MNFIKKQVPQFQIDVAEDEPSTNGLQPTRNSSYNMYDGLGSGNSSQIGPLNPLGGLKKRNAVADTSLSPVMPISHRNSAINLISEFKAVPSDKVKIDRHTVLHKQTVPAKFEFDLSFSVAVLGDAHYRIENSAKREHSVKMVLAKECGEHSRKSRNYTEQEGIYFQVIHSVPFIPERFVNSMYLLSKSQNYKADEMKIQVQYWTAFRNMTSNDASDQRFKQFQTQCMECMNECAAYFVFYHS